MQNNRPLEEAIKQCFDLVLLTLGMETFTGAFICNDGRTTTSVVATHSLRSASASSVTLARHLHNHFERINTEATAAGDTLIQTLFLDGVYDIALRLTPLEVRALLAIATTILATNDGSSPMAGYAVSACEKLKAACSVFVGDDETDRINKSAQAIQTATTTPTFATGMYQEGQAAMRTAIQQEYDRLTGAE